MTTLMRDAAIEPSPGAVALPLAGESVWLLPQRALWWPAADTMFVADVHLGKAASFRALGQPVPSGTTRDNLDRLSDLIDRFQAKRLVVLGDFLHAATAQQSQVIEPATQWRARHADLVCVLVRGNHDSHAGDPPPSLRFEIVDEPHPLGPFLACHMPAHAAGGASIDVAGSGSTGFANDASNASNASGGASDGPAVRVRLAGHLHPAVWLRGPAADRLRLPCFCKTADQLILPAFGAFTGSTVSGLPADARCYPIGGGRVHGPIASGGSGPRWRRG
ncbi:ligase-associated DNA damage response endonuclease PdeM [Roseateles amylovorans]|uniref:Ligase-associated DNA damage response endonuclease PdeM n=1 Tax=Roseateles amylovorans TaxID=2978473 RepID=A0ABY6B4V2_9BURK|nr:ligase-associated DNA damage response endonuclease PdeM [Roseateles amylovorans]UXH80373.1 ligase-associated DNA damage response endonuclease PdeM [Roseateles amylovorans]